MEKIYNDDTFLARWIENGLSTEELEQFKDSCSYHEFHKINEASKLLKAPDFHKSAIFDEILNNIPKKRKSKKFIRWTYSAAASIILLFSLFYITNTSNANIATKFSEFKNFKLPDSSLVHLSPNSHVTFNKKNWSRNRSLSLTGEAFFEVTKGKSFVVNTTEGSVVVLGTKFAINMSQNFFEIACYEGKVKIITNNKSEYFLTKGEAFRTYNNKNESWNFIKKSPSWLQGESDFTNTPLIQVIKNLEKHYNITVATDKININKRFTGTFTHKDINVALKTVFAPLQISFRQVKNNTIILSPS